MTLSYQITPAAAADLDTQADYLAREAGMDVALRFYVAAANTFASIARMPGLGERRESKHIRLDGSRVWRVEGFERHLVFYRQTDEGLLIIRVLHSARDVNRLIEEEQ